MNQEGEKFITKLQSNGASKPTVEALRGLQRVYESTPSTQTPPKSTQVPLQVTHNWKDCDCVPAHPDKQCCADGGCPAYRMKPVKKECGHDYKVCKSCSKCGVEWKPKPTLEGLELPEEIDETRSLGWGLHTKYINAIIRYLRANKLR